MIYDLNAIFENGPTDIQEQINLPKEQYWGVIMNQDKVSQFIKNIRKKNNLTQKDLASKYGVTYQAVSKWENGKNLPDMFLLKQMSEDFNVSLDEILGGEYNSKS